MQVLATQSPPYGGLFRALVPSRVGHLPVEDLAVSPVNPPPLAIELPLSAGEERDPALEMACHLGPGAWVAGLDEAGRGPLAGPVVAAAVVLNPGRPIEGLADSKRLGARRRALLFEEIQARARAVGIASVEAHEIDARNILQASLIAMARALTTCEAMLGGPVAGAVVDGNQLAPLPARVVQRAIVGGDGRSQAIMAASILAKVTRDRRMVDEARAWPGYGFESHKGYPTRAHREALLRLGPCPLHRRSFRPVAQAIEMRVAGGATQGTP